MGERVGTLGVVVWLVGACGARPGHPVGSRGAPAASDAAAGPTLQVSLSRSPETVRSLRRAAGCETLAATDRVADPVRDPQRAVCSTWHHVLTMQADARKDRDLIRLQCSAEKLTELEQVLDEALALGAGDASALASDTRRRIVALDQLAARSYALDAAAAACVGEDAGVIGRLSPAGSARSATGSPGRR